MIHSSKNSSNSLPLVSVILPLYNEKLEYASMAISSIITQTYSNLEIIIILDNPHNDELKNYIEKLSLRDSRIQIIINEKNLGLPDTLNRGITLASGEYIARMDGDDISFPDRIKTQIDYLLHNTEIDLIGSEATIIDQNNKIIGRYTKLQSNKSLRIFTQRVGPALTHPTWIGNSKVFKKLKYRNFPYVEDYDFLLRAIYNGYKIGNIKKSLLKYRIVQDDDVSLSRKFAFIQYKNTLIAQKLYKIAKKQHIYPEIPPIEYSEKDIKSFSKLNSVKNKLRNYLNQHKYWKAVNECFKILKSDYRPLLQGIKQTFWLFLLRMIDKNNR